MCRAAGVIPIGGTIARATGHAFVRRVASLVAIEIPTERLQAATKVCGIVPSRGLAPRLVSGGYLLVLHNSLRWNTCLIGSRLVVMLGPNPAQSGHGGAGVHVTVSAPRASSTGEGYAVIIVTVLSLSDTPRSDNYGSTYSSLLTTHVNYSTQT